MKKLIKLSSEQYVVIDEKVNPGDFILQYPDKNIIQVNQSTCVMYDQKITHSTKPLEDIGLNTSYGEYLGFDKINPISLQEVEELVLGYSVEKMAKDYLKSKNLKDSSIAYTPFVDGLKAHQELTKDKLFTIEDMQKALWCLGDVLFNNNQHGIDEGEPEKYFDSIIKSILPKNEWLVDFDENGKLKLI